MSTLEPLAGLGKLAVIRAFLMKRVIIALALAGVGAFLLPETALANEGQAEEICRNVVANRGYNGYKFTRVETMTSRSGGYGVSGQIHKAGKRFEFNCVLDSGLILKDITINPLDGSRHGGGRQSGAPAEAQVACAEEADRYWGLKPGTAVPQGSRSTGSGMYEVKVRGRKHSGTCTVTKRGDVKGIMND